MRKKCLDCVYELAKSNPNVIYIGSDVGVGTLENFKQEFPERFFMEGISEAHLVGMASGLAKEGYFPYINTIATFLTRRCYEQIAIDLCLENLPVRLIANGGGLVYAPLGPTHLAIDDIALMRVLPNMTIIAPCDALEMERLMLQTLDIPGPIYIRVGKGNEPIVSSSDMPCAIGKAVTVRNPEEITILTTGIMLHQAIDVANLLALQSIPCGIIHFHTVKPFDSLYLLNIMQHIKLLVTLEEHSLKGGLSSEVLECLADHAVNIPQILRFGLADTFPHGYGSQAEMLERSGLCPKNIFNRIKNNLIEKEGVHA